MIIIFLPLLKYKPDEDAFLSSVQYKIRQNENVLAALLRQGKAENALANFFENHFNEDIHRSAARTFMETVQKFLWQSYLDHGKDIKSTLETVYSTLRLIQFIHQKDNANE